MSMGTMGRFSAATLLVMGLVCGCKTHVSDAPPSAVQAETLAPALDAAMPTVTIRARRIKAHEGVPARTAAEARLPTVTIRAPRLVSAGQARKVAVL